MLLYFLCRFIFLYLTFLFHCLLLSLFSLVMIYPIFLSKCTCPKRYLNGLSCKTRWSWSSSSMALTWLYTLYNYICNLCSLFVISCYDLCSLSNEDTRNLWTIIVKYWQIHTSIGRFIYPIRLHHMSYRCLWCYPYIAGYTVYWSLSWHKAKLVSVTSFEGCTHQSRRQICYYLMLALEYTDGWKIKLWIAPSVLV